MNVRYFAVLRDLLEKEQEEVEAGAGETLADLYTRLVPEEVRMAIPVLFARNGAYTAASEPVEEGDEIGFLPPLGGG